jgi:hypothetical protein
MIEVDDIAKSGNTGATSGDISVRTAANLRRTSIDAASRICSSLEYFFEKGKKVIGRIRVPSKPARLTSWLSARQISHSAGRFLS